MQQRLDDVAKGGRDVPPRARGGVVGGQLQSKPLLGGERAAQRRAAHGAEDPNPLHETGVQVAGQAEVERIEAQPAALAVGPEHHRGDPAGGAQGAVLSLGVEHQCLAPEDQLAVHVGLHERALAEAELPQDQHVGIGEQPGVVQLPRFRIARRSHTYRS